MVGVVDEFNHLRQRGGLEEYKSHTIGRIEGCHVEVQSLLR